MKIKKIKKTLLLGISVALLISACGPTAPLATTPDGQSLEGDSKGVQGDITGEKVGAKTMIALYGYFNNVNGNKIDAKNKTIEAKATLAVAPVTDGKYNFSLPKAPAKANTAASLELFAFNDDNSNNMYDSGELKSSSAEIRWVVGLGYQSAKDADGNEVVLADFKDFDFKLK